MIYLPKNNWRGFFHIHFLKAWVVFLIKISMLTCRNQLGNFFVCRGLFCVKCQLSVQHVTPSCGSGWLLCPQAELVALQTLQAGQGSDSAAPCSPALLSGPWTELICSLMRTAGTRGEVALGWGSVGTKGILVPLWWQRAMLWFQVGVGQEQGQVFDLSFHFQTESGIWSFE